MSTKLMLIFLTAVLSFVGIFCTPNTYMGIFALAFVVCGLIFIFNFSKEF